MNDTPQPWAWAYRHMDEADIPDNWSVTFDEDFVTQTLARKRYVITPLYTTRPSRTLREDAAIGIMATVVDWKDWKAEWEGLAMQAVKAADALVQALEEKP